MKIFPVWLPIHIVGKTVDIGEESSHVGGEEDSTVR